MNKIVEFIIIVFVMVGTIVAAIEFGQIGNLESIANLVNVFSGLGWFLSAFGVATLFTAYLVVIAPTKLAFRFLAIPAWLVFSASLLITVDQFMGYSYPALPPQAAVISYYVYKDADNKKMIESWMYLKDEGRARAYNFPHTLEREKALHQGQQGAKKGEPIEIDLTRTGRSGDGEDSRGGLIIYNWDQLNTHPSKEQPENSDYMHDGILYEMQDDGTIEMKDPEVPEAKEKVNSYNDFDNLERPRPEEIFSGVGYELPH